MVSDFMSWPAGWRRVGNGGTLPGKISCRQPQIVGGPGSRPNLDFAVRMAANRRNGASISLTKGWGNGMEIGLNETVAGDDVRRLKICFIFALFVSFDSPSSAELNGRGPGNPNRLAVIQPKVAQEYCLGGARPSPDAAT